MYKIIDTSTWERRTQYEWFKAFSNPCYGINIELDVTSIVTYSKKTKTSFFINFLFIIMLSLNEIPELRLRIVDGEVRLYDTIHPTYTVMTKLGVFDNCKNEMDRDYKTFYEACKRKIEQIKMEDAILETYNDEHAYDVYYITCLPWLTYTSMMHPIPNGNEASCSVPRICFGKFEEKKRAYTLPFNLTVSHALVDGYPCTRALNLLKENCKKAKELFV